MQPILEIFGFRSGILSACICVHLWLKLETASGQLGARVGHPERRPFAERRKVRFRIPAPGRLVADREGRLSGHPAHYRLEQLTRLQGIIQRVLSLQLLDLGGAA
jgi:hypothetical protein